MLIHCWSIVEYIYNNWSIILLLFPVWSAFPIEFIWLFGEWFALLICFDVGLFHLKYCVHMGCLFDFVFYGSPILHICPIGILVQKIHRTFFYWVYHFTNCNFRCWPVGPIGPSCLYGSALDFGVHFHNLFLYIWSGPIGANRKIE